MKQKKINIQKNDCVKLTVSHLGKKGEGVGYIDAFPIMVRGVLPGEVVNVLILKVSSSYAIGKCLEIVTYSEDRVDSFCDVANRCGGCQIQHLSYLSQLALKQQRVASVFERYHHLVQPIIKMSDPLGYRNKAQFAVGQNKNQIDIGLYSINTHHIVDAKTCLIQHPMNQQLLCCCRAFINEAMVSIYDEKNHTGLIRHVVVRAAVGSNESLVCIVINGDKLPGFEHLIEKLREIDHFKGLLININTAVGDEIFGDKTELLFGNAYLSEQIDDVSFLVSAKSFFQTNIVQTKILIDLVLDYADLSGNETVFDAYCGVGIFSLFLAKKAAMVVGVDVGDDAIQDAKQNAKNNQIENVKFVSGQAELVFPALAKEFPPDVVVLDPPRTGCDTVFLDALVSALPQKIIYVSCNPGSLGRDSDYLIKHGFNLRSVQPVDMFPHTMHVECVAVFESKKINK